MQDVIVAGTEEGVKRRRNKRKSKKGKVKPKHTPIVGVDTIGEGSVKSNFKFTCQVMASIPTDES